MIDNGRLAEKKAANYLRSKGYVILDGNYRTRFGEVDIIALKANIIAFVEVKMRSEGAIARPMEFVDRGKQKRIAAAAAQYISTYKIDEQPRFDVIEVFCENNEIKSFKHLENAFELV